MRKAEETREDPLLAVLGKNRTRCDPIQKDEADVMSESASITSSHESTVMSGMSGMSGMSNASSSTTEKSDAITPAATPEEKSGDKHPNAHYNVRKCRSVPLTNTRTRSPIRHPSARNSSINTTISEPNIIDEPMITENRDERLHRRERFKWLVSAWSPE